MKQIQLWVSHLLPVRLTAIGSHLKDDVLKAGSLGHLPMNTGPNIGWHLPEINDEVSDLSEEVVLSLG